MALIALLAAASLTADPPKLILGKDAGANIELQAPAGAKVTFSASAGSIGEARREGGVFKARYTAPALKAPSVALVLAQIDRDGERELAWLAIPLTGSDTMEIETKPGSRVTADVAGHAIGPVTADAKGIVRLPMVVPPGVEKATLHITDKLGNTIDKPLDLEPPPFTRMRMAPRADSASIASPLLLEIFVVRRDGTPDDRATVDLDAEDGDAELRRRIGRGVYLARYVPPAGKTGTVHLVGTANGQQAALDLPIAAGQVMIARPFWKSSLSAERPWTIGAGLIGGVGSTFDGATAGTAMLEAALRIEVLPLEVLLEAGGSWFTALTQPGPALDALDTARPRTTFVQAGVRLGKQLVRGVDGHLALALGAASQSVSRTVGATGAAQPSAHAWTPHLAFAFGANMRIGPGRALAQLQLDASGSNVAGLATSLGGVQLMAGYLVTVR
ncbi:MAG: hypothetical protein ABR567_19535 [Myxococcales bacterium]|nr:hypothetical protein [Myxococcales bacterium]